MVMKFTMVLENIFSLKKCFKNYFFKKYLISDSPKIIIFLKKIIFIINILKENTVKHTFS